MSDFQLDQLKQLITVTWDGNLLSRNSRDWLVLQGYVMRVNGWNYLTAKGIYYLEIQGCLKP